MKKLTLAILLVAGASVSGIASANMSTSTEHNLVSVCKALKSDSKLQLMNAVKSSGVSYENLAQGLVCNGQQPVNFALANGAQKTADLFAKRAQVEVEIAQVNY